VSEENGTFSIASEIGSPADTLQALGAAILLGHLAGAAPEEVRITAEGSGFRIRIRGAARSKEELAPLIPYFLAKDGEAPPRTRRGEIYDYASDKRRSAEKRAIDGARAKSIGPRARKSITQATEEQEDRGTPSRRWPLYNSLQVLTKGEFKAEWNATWKAIDALKPDDAERLGRETWQHLRGSTDAPRLPRDKVTLAQYLNPTAAKGANRTKPDSVKRDNLKDGRRVTEWLKMIALDRLGIVRLVYRPGKVRRVEAVRMWVPIPSDIDLDALLAAQARFNETPWRQGNIKQDVLTSIDFADALARHWIARNTPPRRRANRIVQGVAVASFKNMGGGFNVMNVTSYGLPGWIDLQSVNDLETYLAALDSFRRAAWSLDEGRSDEIPILSSLREAVGSEGHQPVLAFLADYAVFVQRALAGVPRYVNRFSVEGLDAVLGGVYRMLSYIVQNEGFRNIATAIRKATVTEQFHKRNDRQVYDIHYGLFADLRRAARRTPDFVSRLAAFISTYNAENARISEAHREQGRPRARVSDADLDAMVHLIETHGSELVAQLLCAYGSATEKRETSGNDREE
jgi:hypothetical protein